MASTKRGSHDDEEKTQVRQEPKKFILKDPAFQLYLASLSKPEKPVSAGALSHALGAAQAFLNYLGEPITDHSLTDLMKRKEANSNDKSMEKALTVFKTKPKATMNTRHASRIVGMFKRNFVPLSIHIWVKSGRPTRPIAEPILRAVRADPELQQIHYDAIDLVAYAGERIQALARTPPSEITFVEGTNTALIHVTAALSKTAIEHYSAIPRDLAERILQRAQEYSFPSLLPDYQSLWKTITRLTKRKYGITLTSRYFRNRFESIGETIPADKMNPNHWMILAGSKPTYGYKPEIYGLRTEEQLAKEWQTFLKPRLDLTAQVGEQSNQDLAKENAELKEQLLKLTKLLTEKLTQQ